MKVKCAGGCARPLNWTASSQAHADNLLTKHNREYHADEATGPEPRDLDLAAAAAAVLRSDRGSERGGALMVWEALTGMAGADALAYAQQVTVTRQRAALVPF